MRGWIRISALLVAPLLVGSLPGGGEFRVPPPLAQVVGRSAAIVIGRIVSVNDATFELSVSEVIAGSGAVNTSSVVVRRSPRPRTDPRWAPYEKGQEILAFLVKDANAASDAWSFAASPNDSEWPVDEDRVYFYDRFIEGLPLESHRLGGHEFFSHAFSRHATVSALRTYGVCFRWDKKGPDGRTRPRRACGDDVLAAYRAESVIHRLLAAETVVLLRDGRGDATQAD